MNDDSQSKERLQPLDAASLYQVCDFAQIEFETTDDLDDLEKIIGQPRGVEAMEFGVNIEQEGYNIFALGVPGTGKRSLVRQLFEDKVSTKPVPDDWCYVNNFDQSHKPKALRLPAGKGITLQEDMEQLVEELRTALSTAFESEEYHARRQELQQEFQERQQKVFEEVSEEAEQKDFNLVRTSAGLVFAPVREGEVLSPEELKELPEEKRKELEEEVSQLQEKLQKRLRQVPRWQREMREKLRDLNKEFANFAVGGLIDELRQKYEDLSAVVDFLDDVQQDIIENVQDFLSQAEEDQQNASQGSNPGPQSPFQKDSPQMRRYKVNVLVDHSDSDSAPVVFEDNPTFQNVLGRIEHLARMGALMTDFNLIKPGALHRANGGYLLLEARKLLLQPFAWEGLKRALRSGQLRVESPAQMFSLISTVSLEPEPIPLNVKVALVGEPLLYYLLSAYDNEFGELFKVKVDFAERMDRNSGNQEEYARLIAGLVRKNELQPFDRSAVGRVIEHSARLAGDAEKLSTQVKSITDLLGEADYWAKRNGNGTVKAEDVQQAIEAKIYRSDRLRELIQEEIRRGTILIDTEEARVGQVNGLSVMQLGDFAFGRPNRITARIRLGKGEVVNIEREVELSGPIHSKGVLILAGFLGARYAIERPLSLSASLVFEQSYGGIEGDSASSAELYALLSAIAEVPLRQSIAVTGSVNQHGEVQAIGGVNEKIEGFFDVCQARGLTGDQGVLIPASNIKNLMLRQDVRKAVAEEKFFIYPVETIDQGIELLTGKSAGQVDADGNYPEGTINRLVQDRLAELADKRLAFAKSNGTGEE